MKRAKIKKGFSLLEMIISIATLSIASVFILKMFVVSSAVNQRAKDLDIGSNIAMNTIELFKSKDQLQQFLLEDDFLQSKKVIMNDFAVIEQYFDENWKIVPQEAGNAQKKFLMKINIAKKESGETMYDSYTSDGSFSKKNSGILYEIKIHTTNEREVEERKKEVVLFETSKYFEEGE